MKLRPFLQAVDARLRSRPFFLPAAGMILLTALTADFAFRQSSYNLYLYNGFLLACMGAMALNLVMGTGGQISIGTAGFLAVGGFMAVFCQRNGITWAPLQFLVAAVAGGIAGLIVGAPAMRLRGISLAFSTLAANFIILYLATEYQAGTVGAIGFSTIPLFAGTGMIAGQRYWALTLLIIVFVIILVITALERGKAGRSLRAIRDFEAAAPALGIRVRTYKLGTFALTSAIIALEGALIFSWTGSLTSDTYSLTLAFQYIAIVIIGGQDSAAGAIIGAGVITALPTITENLVNGALGQNSNAAVHSGDYATILYGILVIIVLMVAPQGLVGALRDGWDKILGRESAARRRRPVVSVGWPAGRAANELPELDALAAAIPSGAETPGADQPAQPSGPEAD